VRLVIGGLAAVAIQLAHFDVQAAPFEAEDRDVARGNRALAEGRAADAVDAYGEAEKRLGRDPRLSYDKGLAEAARGELDLAIAELSRAVEGSSDPNLRARAAFALGNAYRKLKKYDDAIGAYKRSLLEDPRLDGARRNLELARSMKKIQEAQPKDPNQKNEGEEPPPNDQDGGQPDASEPPDASDGDAGPPDAGSGDAGASGDAGSGDSGASSKPQGADAGAGPDGGSSGQEEQEPPKEEELGKQDAEQLLDALEEQEKALERKKLLEKIPRGKVEKDW
jgi:tetratricopeptide (TPR) repeat protein